MDSAVKNPEGCNADAAEQEVDGKQAESYSSQFISCRIVSKDRHNGRRQNNGKHCHEHRRDSNK